MKDSSELSKHSRTAKTTAKLGATDRSAVNDGVTILKVGKWSPFVFNNTSYLYLLTVIAAVQRWKEDSAELPNRSISESLEGVDDLIYSHSRLTIYNAKFSRHHAL